MVMQWLARRHADAALAALFPAYTGVVGIAASLGTMSALIKRARCGCRPAETLAQGLAAEQDWPNRVALRWIVNAALEPRRGWEH